MCVCVCLCVCVCVPACGPQYCLELSSCGGQKVKACKVEAGGLVEGKHRAYRLSAASRAEQDGWVASIRWVGHLHQVGSSPSGGWVTSIRWGRLHQVGGTPPSDGVASIWWVGHLHQVGGVASIRWGHLHQVGGVASIRWVGSVVQLLVQVQHRGWGRAGGTEEAAR